MIGETIAHYRVTGLLGAGAMGEVYLAEDLRLHRPVALKMLPAGAAGDAAASARLVREARVASALNHPGIAVIYEIGEAERGGNDLRFIAMEYVPGQTLAAVAKSRRLEADEMLDLVGQAAEALAEAHERGVVHRDVKPGNLMVTARGRVEVSDFGLAKYAPPGDEETATWSGKHRFLEEPGTVMGTIAYMSPEQARGKSLDARSDVFSLGVVLYELLAGRRPFAGENAIELIDAILREPPPPLGAPIAPELARIALRMLEKDRERRHPDMRAVCRDLAAFRAGQAPEPWSPDAVPSLAVLSFGNITKSGDDDWLGTGIAETVTAGLSGLPGLAVLSRERVVEVLRKLAADTADEASLAARAGRELGARLVVSGAFQRLGEQVRVTARLADLASGSVDLTVKLDGNMSGIFELQDRLVGELTAGLRLRLPATSPGAEETQSVEAYEALSKGLINLRTESLEALDRAILFFERAAALDPLYARAHFQVGVVYDFKADALSMADLHQRSLDSLDRALALRPSFAEAWRVRASVLLALGREDEAVASVEKALALQPGDASAYASLGRVHFIGRGDFALAADCFEKAREQNPQAGWAALQLSHCAALLGDFPRAEAAAWRAITLQEEFLSGTQGLVIVGAYVRLGHCYALQGRHGEALQQFEREMEFTRRVDHALRGRIFIELHQRIGEARLRTGDTAGGRAALDLAIDAFERRVRTGAEDPATRYYAACAYALRGDTEAALVSLEKAATLRRRLTIARARHEPALEGLRGLERFQALVPALATTSA